MIKSVSSYAVSELFNIEMGVVYVIPRYQREYAWGRYQWEAVLDDVLENNPGYFLGSIICINQSQDALAIQRLEVVDGQQRLTTLSLLFAAMYQALKSQQIQLDEDQKNELTNLKRKLVLRGGDDQMRVIPQVQNNNNADYRAILAEIGVVSPCPAPARAGNRQVYRAFRYFKDRLARLGNRQGAPVTAVLELLDRINKAALVKIEVASHADAYTLFESLNNRGMPLTAIDLIKNKLLAELEGKEPGKIDHYFGRWTALLGCLGDDYRVHERFFRHYYNGLKEELKEPWKNGHQPPMATRSNLIHIYEKLIGHDAKFCLQHLCQSGALYAQLLPKGYAVQAHPAELALRNLDRIQGAPSHLLMLNLLARREQLQHFDRHLAAIARSLVRFFVRRNLTDTPPTRDLTRLFMGIIDKLAGQAGHTVVDTVRQQLLAVSANDDAFRAKLEGPIYDENVGVTRFILCALAEQGMTRETWVDLWRMESQQFVWTVEHIFPQGDNIPKTWVTMIAGGDAVKAKEYQQLHVHKLGNLTLSGFNSSLGNKSFVEKRDRKDAAGNPVGYRNGLRLNEDLVAYDSWSVAQIEARTDKLVDQAMALFQMDGD